MYARVITSEGVAGKQEAAANKWRESVLPGLDKTPGFKGAFLMSEPNGKKSLVITLWETEADAKRVDTSGSYQQALAAMKDYFTGQPVLTIYEVDLQV